MWACVYLEGGGGIGRGCSIMFLYLNLIALNISYIYWDCSGEVSFAYIGFADSEELIIVVVVAVIFILLFLL